MNRNAYRLGLVGIALLLSPRVQAEDFATDATASSIQTFLRGHVEIAKQKAAIVVGIVDANGSRVICHGELSNGTDRPLDGDSLFFIGSVSKTFTDLLLLDMVERGKMQLEDPVAKYLPDSIEMPTHGGKEITLLHLATHTAGLPANPDNMSGADVKEQYETYTVEKMYDFLSDCKLSAEPGERFGYSNVGMALLGHAMERRSGARFESLVIDRICRPLAMDSTCIRLPPESKARLAMGHDDAGNLAPPWRFQAYTAAGDIHSSAHDLLKYVSAQAGITTTPLTRQMVQSQVFRHEDKQGFSYDAYSPLGRTAMPWVDRGALQPPGMELLGHAGGAGSYHAWVGFDKKQRRGVVVLSTANDLSVEAIGWNILQRTPLTNQSKHHFNRELVGIGTALEADAATTLLRITKVYPNSPAAQAGVAAGVLIRKIDDMPIAGKSLEECLGLIRGPIGTKVRLELNNPLDGVSSVVEVRRGRFVMSG